MKLIRFGKPGAEQPGVQIGDQSFSTADFFQDYDEAFFAGGGVEKLRELVASQPLEEVLVDRLGSPIARPSKIVCIGLNYRDHAEETGAAVPAEPVLFLKSTTALCGPFDEVIIPRGSEKTDWEVELAVVIGKRASYVTEQEADQYIAGYCLHNDISERAFQLERGGTWDKGKGCDTFAPMGPYLVTPDEIADVHQLRLWLTVNGEVRQSGNTSNLIFKIPEIVAYVSQFMTLLPGDIISTGTPAGVGLGMTPPTYLKAGDQMELGIDGLGVSKQTVCAFSDVINR
jgi:2-keto-4-pentenoate hydratase/2-oxohepta-3-ene-1,7-dioic acid hydratase in catechol pathway